jgi:hypothetical protein
MKTTEKINELTKYLHIIFLCKFGSHLYGTNTKSSDEDYKGIFLPTREQCFLNRIPKSITYNSKKNDEEKNSAEDIDIEIYSIHYYLDLLKKGDTGALDILHAWSNNDSIMQHDSVFLDLYDNRSDFYTTNLRAFVGYCRTQAAKYGVKGSRLNDSKVVIDYLKSRINAGKTIRLEDIWDSLPTGDHLKKIPDDPENGFQFPMYDVCNRKLQSTVTIQYAYDVIEKFYLAYGERAQKAAENKGIDWKAVSHALRCAYQMRSLYREGDIIFPLKEADELLRVKNGECDYMTEVAPKLESLMDEVEDLCAKSNLPKKVDSKKWDEWILSLYQ